MVQEGNPAPDFELTTRRTFATKTEGEDEGDVEYALLHSEWERATAPVVAPRTGSRF